MSEPIRILHVLGGLGMGGAESRVMDLYRHMDRSRVQFDFLVHYARTQEDAKENRISSEELFAVRPPQHFDSEVLELGGHIYVLPRFNGKNLPEYRKAVQRFFNTHKGWTAIEGHMTSMAGIYLPIAKKSGIPVTIAHARSAGVDAGIRGIATRLFRLGLADRCDHMLACSVPAGISVFGKKAVDSGRVALMPNAVDVTSYAFDSKARKSVRDRFGIPEGRILLGHVGRFDPVKNHAFFIEVLEKLVREDPERDYGALLVGDGVLRPEIEKSLAEKGLSDRVVLAGNLPAAETAKLYQAFDIFVFPSLYEGLPGTVIEAQSSGLFCCISDTITQEVCVTDLVRSYPLSDAGAWAEAVKELAAKADFSDAGRKGRSEAAAGKLAEAGYEVSSAARKLQDWYLSFTA